MFFLLTISDKFWKQNILGRPCGRRGELTILSHRSDLVKIEKAAEQSGADQKRLDNLNSSHVGIWWYARFPNHYAGDGSAGSPELGEAIIKAQADRLVRIIQEVKKDENVLRLQRQFYQESQHPLQTKQ